MPESNALCESTQPYTLPSILNLRATPRYNMLTCILHPLVALHTLSWGCSQNVHANTRSNTTRFSNRSVYCWAADYLHPHLGHPL